MITTTASSVAPARLAAWTSRLGNITDEVQSLIHDRDTWHTVSEIGAANPTVVANPFVMGHFNTLYCRRALVSVRAMVDHNNDSCYAPYPVKSGAYGDCLITANTRPPRLCPGRRAGQCGGGGQDDL